MASQKRMAAEGLARTAMQEAKASRDKVDYSITPPICQMQLGENPSVEELEKALNEAIIRRYQRMRAQADEAKAQAVEAAQTALRAVQDVESEAQQAVAKAQNRVEEQQAKIRTCRAAIEAAEDQIDELITRAKLAGFDGNIQIGQAIISAVESEVEGIERSIRGHRLAQANAEKALAQAQKDLDAARSNQARLAALIELARQGREAEALEQIETEEELEVVGLLVEARGLYQQARAFHEAIPADVQARLEAMETAQRALAEAQKALDEGRLMEAQAAFEKGRSAASDETELELTKNRLAQAWAREAQRLACGEQIDGACKALERARDLGATDRVVREAQAKIDLHDLRHRVKGVDTTDPQKAMEHLAALQQEAEQAGFLPAVISLINHQRKAAAARQKETNFLWAQTRRYIRQLATQPEDGVVAYSPLGPGRILGWAHRGNRFQAICAYQWVGRRRDGRWLDGPPARRIVVDTLPRQAVAVSQVQ